MYVVVILEEAHEDLRSIVSYIGVTRLFVRYCTLRSHLLNEEPEREDCGIAFSGQVWGCVVSVGDHDFCR